MDQYSIISRILHYFNIDELFEYKSTSPQFYDVCHSKLYKYQTNKWFNHHFIFKPNNLEFGNQCLKQKGIFDKINGVHFTVQLFAHQIGITIRSIFNKIFSFAIPLNEVPTDVINLGFKCEILDLPIAEKTKTILLIMCRYSRLGFMVLIEIDFAMLMKNQHRYYLVEKFELGGDGYANYEECEQKRGRINLFHLKCPNPISQRQFISMLYKMYPKLHNCPTDDFIFNDKYHSCVQQNNRTFIYNSSNSKFSYDSELGKLTVCDGSDIKHLQLEHEKLFILNGRWIVHDLSFNNQIDPNVIVYDYEQNFKVVYNFFINRSDLVRMFDHHHLIFRRYLMNDKRWILFNLHTNQKTILPNLSFKIICEQSTIIDNTLYYFEEDQFDKDAVLTRSLNLKKMIIAQSLLNQEPRTRFIE